MSTIQAQIPGRNVNMVSGTKWPEGDPFLQRQNEPSVAASTRNPLHLLGGSNDYRTVDVPGLEGDEEAGDAWLGLFKSTDGGQRWTSGLLPGYPQDNSPAGLASPLRAKDSVPGSGYQAGADAVVRAGTNGLIYYSGLAFDRTDNGKSGVFLARFIDNNNQEAGNPVAYLGTTMVAQSIGAKFLDKPWMAVDIPRNNAAYCIVTDDNILPTAQNGRRRHHGWDRNEKGNRNKGRGKGKGAVAAPPGSQRIPAGAVYVSYSSITGDAATLRSEIFVTRSMDCGNTWSTPIKVSRQEDAVNQGSTLTIDPRTGAVYIGWRRFDPDLTDAIDLDGIMVARLPFGASRVDTPNRAHKFPKPERKVGRKLHRLFEHRGNRFTEVSSSEATENLDQFDLGTTGYNFRTNAYPTMTSDATGRVYVAWTQRGFAANPTPGTATTPASSGATDGARVVIATTRDGRTFTAPAAVDDHGVPGRGHQLMPSMAFAGGKLMLVFYDLRESKANTHNRISSDYNTNSGLRQTVDIRSAMASPGDNPVFAPSVKVSDYLLGFNPQSRKIEELQVNPPNLPMFKKGTVPFIGDYIDVAAAPAFIPGKNGRWEFNTASTGALPVFHAVWTDNRDVRPPKNGEWWNYPPAKMSPNQMAGASKYDPSQNTLQCVDGVGNPGSRNQNVYSARITGGLIAGSPGNAKPLSPELQRGFVVFAQNTTRDTKSFRMTILSQPVGGRASFDQFPLPPYTTTSPAPKTAIEMIVPPLSTASRTVYVTSTNPDAALSVDVSELNDLRLLAGTALYPSATEKTGGLEAVVLLNPDIENPDIENPDIENPDIENPDIANVEVYNPDIENPDIENPDIENPDIENPDIENVRVANPDIENPNILNPDIENPDIENPDIENPDIENPDIENGAIADITWKVSNTGNTTASFNVNLFLAQQSLPTGVKTQLLLLKTYRTPVTQANKCQLGFQVRNILLANIRSPKLVPPGGGTANANDPAETNATLWLAPGEEGRIVLRVIDDDTSNNVPITKPNGDVEYVDPSLVPTEDVSPKVQQQAVNSDDAATGVTVPPVVPPPAPPATNDTVWTSPGTPVRVNVLANDAALFGSTKIVSTHTGDLAQNMGGTPQELVYMPTTGLLYVGSSRAVGVVDPATNHLVGRMPIDPSDPAANYGIASATTGLVFFRMGGNGQTGATLYGFDARPGSPTFNQPLPIPAAAGAAIDALGSTFTFALDTTGKTLFYVAGTIQPAPTFTATSTLNAIDGGADTLLSLLALPSGGTRTNNLEDRLVVHYGTGKVFLRGPQHVFVVDGLKGSPTFNTSYVQLGVGPEFSSNNSDMVVNQATGVVVSTGNFRHEVTLINVATNAVTPIPTLRAIGDLAVDPATTRLFAADYLNSVHQIDSVTSAVTSLALFPETGIPVTNSVTNRAYVAGADESSTIFMTSGVGLLGDINGLTLQKGRWGFGARDNASNSYFYVNSGSDVAGTGSRPGALVKINGATDTVTDLVATIGQPFGMGVNQNTGQVIVAGFNGIDAAGLNENGKIRIHDALSPSSWVDANTAAVVPFTPTSPAIGFGRQVVTNPDTNLTYVQVQSGSNTSVVYLPPAVLPGVVGPIVTPITLPASFGALTFNATDRVEVIRTLVLGPGNSRVFLGTFNGSQYKVVALDGNNTVVGAYAGGGHSRLHTASWLEVNPNDNSLFVVDYNADNVTKLDGATLAVQATTPLPDGPSATALNGSSLAVASSVKLPLHAFFLAVNESEGRIYTTGGNSPDESGAMVISDVAGQLGAPVSVTSATNGAGTTTVNDDYSLTYVPGPGFTGVDTITYTAQTPAGASTGTVTVNVIPVTAAPFAVDDAFATPQGVTLNVNAGRGVLSNDVVSNFAAMQVVQGPANGVLTPSLVNPGQFSYAPFGGYTGPDQFKYLAVDGANSNVATVSINVTVPTNPLIVINTNDSGLGSLRAAMTYANSTPGTQTISFAIPGLTPAAPGIITVISPLPVITESVVIDGTSQWSGSLPLVEVSGGGTVGTGFQTDFDKNFVEIRGLAITRFTQFGIQLLQADSAANNTGHTVAGNTIGTDRFGNAGKGNGTGIEVRRDDSSIYGNTISGNAGPGLLFRGDADDVQVVGNVIGLSPANIAVARANGVGILMMDSVDNVIIDNNAIAGNGGFGIEIQDSLAGDVTGTMIIGNRIGLNQIGNPVPNGGGGIQINNAPGTMIGIAGNGNIIGGNANPGFTIGGPGIRVLGSPAVLPTIRFNRIGTDPTGTVARPNRYEGIVLQGQAIVGGNRTANEGNLISGNGNIATNSGTGILIGVGSNGSVIRGNTIGLTATGGNLGNAFSGISVVGDLTSITIGGDNNDLVNVISGNPAAGISIYSLDGANPPGSQPRPREIQIQANSIYGNGGHGIDLDNNGVSPNDAGDTDPLAGFASNDLQNFPVLTSAVNNGGPTQVTVDLSTLVAGYTYRVRFFANTVCDPSGNGEGQTWVGMADITQPGGSANLLSIVPAGQFITATATDSDGNTSEFSACRVVTTPAPPAIITSVSPDPSAPGFGQHLFIRGTNLPGASPADVILNFAGSDNTAQNIWHISPTLVVARFNMGTPVGPATIRIKSPSGAIVSNSFAITLQATPGAPTMTAISAGPGGTGFLATTTAGATIYVSSEGTDTSGVTVVFTPTSPAGAPFNVGVSSTSGGAGGTFSSQVTVPAMAPGTVFNVQVKTTVGANSSPLSNAQSMSIPSSFTVVGPAGGGGGLPFGPYYCPAGFAGNGLNVATNDTPINDIWGYVNYDVTAAELMCNNGSSTTKFGGGPTANTPLQCAPGELMVGMFGAVDGAVLGAIGPRCQNPAGGPINQPWGARPAGGTPFTLDCPANTVVVGVEGRQGAVLDNLALICGPKP